MITDIRPSDPLYSHRLPFFLLFTDQGRSGLNAKRILLSHMGSHLVKDNQQRNCILVTSEQFRLFHSTSFSLPYQSFDPDSLRITTKHRQICAHTAADHYRWLSSGPTKNANSPSQNESMSDVLLNLYKRTKLSLIPCWPQHTEQTAENLTKQYDMYSEIFSFPWEFKI